MADPSIPYLAAGFGATWVLMAAYFLRLARAQRTLERRLEDAERAKKGGAD